MNTHIKELIESDELLVSVCVRGELSNYKVYPSGHHYFTLKDSESTLRCVMFRQNAMRMRFRPENGMQLVAFGRISLYLRDGAYQLYVTSMMPDGVGDLYTAFEQLKTRLAAEGLFSPEHKRPLPAYPGRIAVITSPAGAAVRDVIRILGARWPLAQVLVVPVRVQGSEAPPEIAEALQFVNDRQLADLIITGRGGGSLEDLWAFNDERVARAIHASRIPVISAVGHEPDVTISDFVADLRAATPSNAAELAVPESDELRQQLDGMQTRLNHTMETQLQQLRAHLDELSAKRVMRDAGVYVAQRRAELQTVSARLSGAEDQILHRYRERFSALAAKLDALSPLKVLGRGYAIARTEQGSVLHRADQVQPGDRLLLRLEKGSLDCTVDEVRSRE